MSDESQVPLDQETDYFAKREAQERLAAVRSVDMSARRAHADLAERYALRRSNAQRPVA